jgi:hypothetical protein
MFPHHGEHRSGLDGDVEHVAPRNPEPEQVAGQDEVPGARDRQEFGQAFDDAEDEGVDEVGHRMNALMLAQNSAALSVLLCPAPRSSTQRFSPPHAS